ncbi:membrane fusion protein (multidrug efflux system) [Ereboglobus sp. PH5-5]|uniref:efflux RND transporter periplasmic adaptor subunit n=1 Tax=Ereboglobus sp. PH5-5 TaxID=2940529 RepID=UPI00240516F7|nr:efflux RND transporter periplasmic adaptor subunit [Ereboglobus sp. PH5-5]MDF9833502.1 membrane fusion protein (multidrug efflux system) [Ereboglobus sp. PH5-5]
MKPSKNSRDGRSVSRVILPLLATLVATAFAAGCSKKAQQGGRQMAALEVGVYTVKAEPVTLTRKLPGRTSAYRVAEVRARVNGIVQKRLFNEGSEVKEGQQLYQIDDAPYVATLESAKATLARAQASLVSSQAMADRYSELIKTNSVSKQDYDNVVAQAKAAVADVKAAEAAVTNAEINLSYTKVYSPITGRIGKSEVTEGAYVQAATATLLATVQQLDPIYVDITQPAGQALQLEEYREAGLLQAPKEGFDKAILHMFTGKQYGKTGKIQFADISVNPSTSSIMMRAEFANTTKGGVPELLPGLFVHVEIVEGVAPQAILVPQQGVSRNTKGQPIAYVVAKGKDGGDTVELRVLKADRTIGAKWLITDGIKAGEQVVVEGLQYIRQPGIPVKPRPAGQTPGSMPIE